MYIPLDTWSLPLRSDFQTIPHTCTALQSNDGIGSDNLEFSDPESVDNEIKWFNTQGVMRRGCLLFLSRDILTPFCKGKCHELDIEGRIQHKPHIQLSRIL